jgi:hypothetical protein
LPSLPTFPGATVAVVASGPTLTDLAVAPLRGRVPVVAVNDAIRLVPWADVLYSSDRRWWAVVGPSRSVQAYTGIKVSIGWRPGDASPIPKHPDVQVLVNTGEAGLEPDPGGLRTGRHSGYAAINLAVHLGARRILLLGYTLGRVGGQAHFFGAHPAVLHQTTDQQYATFRAAYLSLAPALQQRGIEVVNCTPSTHLHTFPNVPLADALAAEVAC